jgi:ATP-dependent 26S proteasome regulatory subunit
VEFPSITIIATANKVDKLDSALLRAGRLDEPIEFAAQDSKDRERILKEYATVYKVDIDDDEIKSLTTLTSGLSAAYLKEVIIQRKYSSSSDTCDIIKVMRSLLKLQAIEKPAPLKAVKTK